MLRSNLGFFANTDFYRATRRLSLGIARGVTNNYEELHKLTDRIYTLKESVDTKLVSPSAKLMQKLEACLKAFDEALAKARAERAILSAELISTYAQAVLQLENTFSGLKYQTAYSTVQRKP